MTDVAVLAAAFGERLWRSGVATSAERDARFASALAVAWPSTVEQLYWLARVTYVSDRAGIATFDAVFDEVFRGHVDVVDAIRNPDVPRWPAVEPPGPDPVAGPRPTEGAPAADRPSRAADGGAGRADLDGVVAASADERELLAARSFDACTDDELEHLGRTIALLRVDPPRRRSRRSRRHPHGTTVDWRATLRAARRTGGDPIAPVTRRRRTRPRRIVLLADVSRSMERYSRAYLYLLHGAVRAIGAEAFVFATRLTRLTRALAGTNAQLALSAAIAGAPDWSGGTRVGDALTAFLDTWGRRGLARGAVVVIVSDGWDAGDPAVVRTQMRRLSLLAHRVVWVNPRAQSPRFEPRTGGMAAALPYVDELVSGHSLDAVEAVIAAIRDP
jgi:uncharacterized protein